MSKELWIKAEEELRVVLSKELQREPTQKEIDDRMRDFYGSYLGALIDQECDRLKGE
jgi:hypothetical protein